MSQRTGKSSPLPRICPCTGNSLEGCFPDKNFPWEETESAFCKWLWKITPRIQTLSKLCENIRHFTIKIFWLWKPANLSASLWKEPGKWSGFPSATDSLLWQWAITSFPSVTETSQAPGTSPSLPPLPPACCWKARCSLPSSQTIVGAFTFYA